MAPAIKSRTGDAVNLKKSIVLRPSVVELPWGNFASRIQGWGGRRVGGEQRMDTISALYRPFDVRGVGSTAKTNGERWR